ncbi:phage tail tape measure protein [Streptomyces sp. S1D4-20]|uniref:phage tail tape measure protein n=1 Tax=Streptomyces sp. S1D4-20 TaxID=2594462 RepID=UPI0023DDF326|nr:phage tail tape measure protein [Streptomyces sp. S1D4-20]
MKTFHKTALLAGAGLAVIGVESVRMASKFDSSMTLLHTQAGVAQDKMAGLKKGVLDLAGKVGQDPDSLAESLFHVESNFESMGISSKKALDLVGTAAKGATTGHAKLVDVTNALTAAVASGIPGVQNMDQAMGVLNATVGVGDMKMQDLANAFGSGMVATVKGFGLSITDVGAALAVFGDNNIRGALAGNQLRMSVMALAKPVQGGSEALKSIGLQTDTLAKDMQKGGLKLALEDLVQHMHAAGISSKQQGQIITDAFGRKAGAGLNILVGQIDRLESKYPALEKGAKGFGQAWADTQKTFAFQTKRLQTSFEALMITVGEKLIPPLQAFVGMLLAHKTATIGVTAALAGLLAATVAVSAAMKVAAAAQMLWTAGGKAVLVLQGVFEGVALKAMYMREAFIAAGGGVAGLKMAFAELGAVGKASVIVGGLALLAVGVAKLADMGKSAPPDIDKLKVSLEGLASSGKFSGELGKTFGDMDGLINKVHQLNAETAKSNNTAFGFRIPGLDDLADKIANTINNVSKGKNSLDSLKGDFKSLDESMAGLASGGHAAVAAKDFDMMTKALRGAGVSTKQINSLFPKYREALVGLKGEQEVTAQSMGLFGDAAVSTQAKLDAEAQAAEGLRQSIEALNAVHRGAFDAETAFYQAMSDASKAVKDNGHTLNLNTDAGRKNRDVLSQLAAKTEDLVDKKLKEKVSWDQVDKTYAKGRKSLIDTAMAMGDTKKQAQALADTLLKAPNAKKLQISADTAAAKKDVEAFNSAVKKSPGSKSVTLSTLSGAAEKVLEAFGYKVTHLKNGSVRVTAATGGALSGIQNVSGALNALNGKTATTYVITKTSTSNAGNVFHEGGKYAHGGLVRRYADGGSIEGGSGTQDDVPLLAMGGEFIVNKRQTQKYRSMLEAINEDRVPHFAKGGITAAEKTARAGLSGQFGISYFGRMAGYSTTPFERSLGSPADLGSLTQALNEAAGQIRAAFHGRTEARLEKELDSVGKSLIRYDKQLYSVTRSLDSAKTKLDGLRNSASQLSDSVKSNVLSSSSITQGVSAGSTVTVASLMGGLTQSRDKASAFADALKGLKGKGLSKDLLQQIAEAGVNGGGLETAGALLGASGSEISSINSLQGQIAKAASSAGSTTASAVYGAAIKAQEKLVTSLTRQQDKLEKAMSNLAKVMERALSRAVKGKSSGGIVGAAASGGVRGGLTWVGEYEPELLELPVGSRVHSGPDSRRMAGGGGGGPAHAVLEIRSGGSETDEFILQLIRRAVRVRGGNVQLVLAGRPV